MSKFPPGEYKMRGGGRAVVLGTIPESGELVGYAYTVSGSPIGAFEWFSGGAYYGDGDESEYDLMPPTRAVWINVYPEDGSCITSGHHGTRAEADKAAGADRIACIRVEYTEGEGL